jgi:diaminobutyrate-2-oxoglutarate transaminase
VGEAVAADQGDISAFEELESNVRYYCRRWPTVFASAAGSRLVSEDGTRYLDFFSGAGALSYGHNAPFLVEAAVDHLRSGRLIHSLDTHTPEKAALLRTLQRCVLSPRGMDMVVQFVGPTGATAVEAALQLAERITGRRGVVAFEGGFHGMTARAASVSHSLGDRDHSGARFLPYRSQPDERDLQLLKSALERPIGDERPGALIIEPVQAEGGARPFTAAYLAEVRRLCTDHEVVLIADEIQAGVGRTGPFFSSEGSGLDPDIICVSKSLSGLGLPLAVNLIRRDLDRWAPGEFTGTFRGNNLAFVTATALLERYWGNGELESSTGRRGQHVGALLGHLAAEDDVLPFSVSGRGFLWGLTFEDGRAATAVVVAAFRSGLIVEACGAGDRTVKLLPSLLIDDEDLELGLDLLATAVRGLSEGY